jgi:hypothetical protein
MARVGVWVAHGHLRHLLLLLLMLPLQHPHPLMLHPVLLLRRHRLPQ